MEPNILKVLGVEAKEDVISNLLAHCFNSSESFRSAFLESVGEVPSGPSRSFAAYTRVAIPGSGVPDLVIVGRREKGTDLLVIENKLKAEEGEDQTDKYASRECIDGLCQKFSLPSPVSPSFIFLTLFPDQQPKNRKFKAVAYSELRSGLERFKPGPSSTTDRLVRDLHTILAEFYGIGTPAPGDKLDEKLADEHPLDRAYLYFKAFVSQIPLPKPLEVRYTFKSSRQGRRFYGACISKDKWQPSEWRKDKDGIRFDPRSDFSIHFEPQYNVLNGTLNVYIHYEINSYMPEDFRQ